MGMMRKWIAMCAVGLGAWLHAEPVKVIFDTDMYTDFDDVGALSCLHAMADAGECEILATVVSTRDCLSAAMCEVVNAYYGRPEIPVGCVRGLGISGDRSGDNERRFGAIVSKYKKWVRHRKSSSAQDAAEIYRKVLASQPDQSVVICSVGFLTNLRKLVEEDRDLVAHKVKLWVAMACAYPCGREYNAMMDVASSRIVLENWPTPVVFSDFQYGVDCHAGRKIAELGIRDSPVADAFRANAQDFNGAAGRSAWDETAVLAAVRGTDRYFNIHRGTYRMVGDKGDNEWIPDESNGLHVRITEKLNKIEVGKVIDELICRGPRQLKDGLNASVSLDDINVRDPFVVADREAGVYRLYRARPWFGGKEVWMQESKDLKKWTLPQEVMHVRPEWNVEGVWAPEVHLYAGKWWLFVTLCRDVEDPPRRMIGEGAPDRKIMARGTWIFRADSPCGPFEPVKEGSVTPPEWACLDGTLWVEDGKPYMVFCHEWEQIKTGTVMCARLKDDLSGFAETPCELFKATDFSPDAKFDPQNAIYDQVTDGPFLYRSDVDGKLKMIWSNLRKSGYVEIVSESVTGKVHGPWSGHRILFDGDGGHGMVFRRFDGIRVLTLHSPNEMGKERIRFIDKFDRFPR